MTVNLTYFRIAEMKIVHGDTGSIAEQVNNMIAQGWQPWGDLIVKNGALIQALVKLEPLRGEDDE